MSSRQNNNGNDAQEKSQRALQALKVTITPTRNLSHTAPTTPTRPTIKQVVSTSAIGLSGRETSNKPSKANRANNDNHGLDLSPWQIPTDPDDMEEEDAQSETPEETRSDIQRKTSTRSFTNLTTSMKKANIKRSQSAKKVNKSPIPSKSPKAAAQGPKKIGSEDDEKNSLRFKEKPRRSLQPMYHSVDGRESPKQKKKVMKTAVGDLEFDLDEKCATEGEEHDNLFEDRSSNKEVHLKELGPVRYSKMSEEDAATVFEMRKRELLAFLIKLGANPNLVKKKFASKNIGALNQLNNSVEMRSSGFDRERVMRTLKGTLEDNLSPNRFIVYNTDRDPIWNNQRGRFATPSRLKNRAASTKGQGRSEPSFKRRNSAKILRDKDEINVVVKRDLTASFNNVVFDNELSDNKSPIKIRKARDPQLRNSHQIVLDPHDISETKTPMKAKKSADTTATHKNQDEKKEVIESFTIDLVKFCSDEKKKKKKKKGKKAKKSKIDDEQSLQLERASQSDTNKLPSENISINTVYESHEDNAAYQKLIETMRQKSKLVMGDINEIDLQIQMMKDDGKKGKNKNRGRDQITLKTAEKPKPIDLEKPKAIFLENLEEGYANVAKMRHAKRSGSFSINIDPYESTPKTNGPIGNKKNLLNQRENETERLRAGQETSRTTLSRNNKTEIITESKSNKKGAARIGSPTFELDRKPKAAVDNESKKKSLQDLTEKRAQKNEVNAPKTPKQGASPTFFGKKETPEITKSKLLSPDNSKTTRDKKSNLIQPQPVQPVPETPQNQQQNDRNKLLNAFRNSSTTTQSNQNAPIRFNEETLKRSTAALQQNNKESTNSNSNFRSNPRPPLLTNDRKMISSPSSAHQVPSTATSNNRSPLMPKQNTKKGLMMNKSQLSIDNNSSSEINESTDLFDKCQTTKSHKVTKSATKSTFSDGVKKILREGSKEDSLLLGPKTSKNQNKASQAPAKPVESSNRPKFEIPTADDIRSKMYKEGRMNHADGTFVKVNYISNGPLELNKPQMKGVVIEEIHNSTTTKAGKDNKPNRKRSLSPRPDSNNTTDRKTNSQINSLQDITEKKNRGAGKHSPEIMRLITEIGVDSEHAERMKLLGQTIKSKREMSSGNQNQNKPYRQ